MRNVKEIRFKTSDGADEQDKVFLYDIVSTVITIFVKLASSNRHFLSSSGVQSTNLQFTAEQSNALIRDGTNFITAGITAVNVRVKYVR